MRQAKDVIVEAVVVGISAVMMGLIVQALIGRSMKPSLPAACQDWNKYHVMEISLFIIGFALHVTYEAVGANAWYSRMYMRQLGFDCISLA